MSNFVIEDSRYKKGERVLRSVNSCGEEVIIPDDVTCISYGAFKSVKDRVTAITISENVTSIADPLTLKNLKSINVSPKNKKYKSVNGDLYSKDGTVLYRYACGKTNTSFTLPKEVTLIGSEAFWYSKHLRNITLNSNVTEIDKGSFNYCDALTYNSYSGYHYLGNESNPYLCIIESINSYHPQNPPIHSSTKIIAAWAFSHSDAITTVNIPKSVKYIGCGAFACCHNLRSLSIPSEVKEIHRHAFSDCTSLKEISLPRSITTINEHTFSGCSGIESIVIPDGVTAIEELAFANCQELRNIYIPQSIIKICERSFENSCNIEYKEFCGAYYCGNKENPYLCLLKPSLDDTTEFAIHPDTKIIADGALARQDFKSVSIPNGVKTIGRRAFENCSDLAAIDLPSSVTRIGDYAFENCSSLTEIVIPNSVHTLGNLAFSGCEGLKEITVPDGSKNLEEVFDLESIERVSTNREVAEAIAKDSFNFEGDTLIKYIGSECDVTVPYFITEIKTDAFADNSCITSVTLPERVKVIGDGAFSGCTSLTSVSARDGLERIGKNAFYNCTGLERIDIPASVTDIGLSAFYNCSSLASITLPDRLKRIEDSAFFGCTALNGIQLPKALESIGSGAFWGCASIEKLSIGKNVTEIGAYAFRDCASLHEVSIENGVRTIGSLAFCGCTKLESLILPITVTAVEDDAFIGLTKLYCRTKKPLFGYPKGWSKMLCREDTKIVWHYKK